ncbi:resolvase [Vibrio alginolyticus]|uniref:resolvase n=1 Tax=Vibrio alginolyticus TaxID=663 RepID=UPI00215C1D41|nr:resolvase [Vibrio alginolyticus]
MFPDKDPSKLPKYDRALKVLKLMGEGMEAHQIAKVLGRPLSTIYKHITAFRHLTGKEGIHKQNVAFNALFFVRMGMSQREVARSPLFAIDHKFISDLCAMDWAIRTLMGNINVEAISAMVELGLQAQQRDLESVREPIAALSDAFDTFLCHLPDDIPLLLEDAITDLTEAVIELEDRVS